VTVTYVLYGSRNVTQLQLAENPQSKGFWVEDLETPQTLQSELVVVNGRRMFRAVVLKRAFFPTQPGQLSIEPLGLGVGYRGLRLGEASSCLLNRWSGESCVRRA